MAEYISTFTTGFSDVIQEVIIKLLPGAKVLKVYDGLVNYYYNGKEGEIEKVLVFNNTFLVIRKYQGKNCDLVSMAQNILAIKQIPMSRKSFRVRYSVNNQFVGMDKSYTRQIETKICRLTNAMIDRLSPQTEYWLIKRSENIGFFCRLMNKRKTTEKELSKGELRPEFAYLMCMLGEPTKNSIVMDAFAGYGSIPKQMQKNFKFKKMYISDLNPRLVRNLRRGFENKSEIDVRVRDAKNLVGITDGSIDVIITDPPWGYYEQIDDIEQFYIDMLVEFNRVMKPNAKLILLSARKDEFESAIDTHLFIIEKRIDTLVNGKKAGVYVIKKGTN